MNFWLEEINKRQKLGEIWSRGTNTSLPFVVNVALNLSNPLSVTNVAEQSLVLNHDSK